MSNNYDLESPAAKFAKENPFLVLILLIIGFFFQVLCCYGCYLGCCKRRNSPASVSPVTRTPPAVSHQPQPKQHQQYPAPQYSTPQFAGSQYPGADPQYLGPQYVNPTYQQPYYYTTY